MMYRLADINALALTVITALMGRIRQVARACVLSIANRIKGCGTGRVTMLRPSRPSGSVRGNMLTRAAGWTLAGILIITLPVMAFALPYGTVMTNDAAVNYDVPAFAVTGLSITDNVTFTIDRHSVFEMLQTSSVSGTFYDIKAGDYDTDGTGTIYNANPAPAPVYANAVSVNIAVPVELEALSTLSIGDPIFLAVTDTAENANSLAVEYVDVTVTTGAGETEIIRLVETGPDTGVFTAYVETVSVATLPIAAYDGFVSLGVGNTIEMTYTDADSTASISSIVAASGTGVLDVTKVSIGNKVAQGGDIQYQVTVDETAGFPVLGVEVVDTLPTDFTYQPGTALINSASAPAYVPLADPAIVGNVLTFDVGDMPGNESVNIIYDVSVAAGATLGDTTDSVYATGSGGEVSNTTSSTVSVELPAVLEILQESSNPLAQFYDINDGLFDDDGLGTYLANPAPAPQYAGAATPVDISVPVQLEPLTLLLTDDPIFLSVTDDVQNTDPLAVDYVNVTVIAGGAGETEIIRLVETGPDTGVFTAYVETKDAIVPVVAYDGFISLTSDDIIEITYTDDDSTASTSFIVADPTMGTLDVTKVSIGNKVAQGGGIQYQVTVDETAGSPVFGVEVIDTLPTDFTYQPGTALINSASAPAFVPLADPAMGAGNEMTFYIGDMAGNESVNIIYDVQVAPGTTLGDTTDSVYATGLGGVVSNTTSATVSVELPATLEILQLSSNPAAPLYDINDGLYDIDGTGTTYNANPAAAPTYAGAAPPVDISVPVPLEPLGVLHMDDPIFLAVTDDVPNADPLVIEYVNVTVVVGTSGELEIIRLVETGPDTGVFTAYVETVDATILPVAAYDGFISLGEGDSISFSYTDLDGANTAAQILADPVSVVFDSQSGALVDGLTVTIIDDATGLPAVVYGDDALTVFPSSIVTGSTITVGAKTYSFPTGSYRFPYIPSGSYRLEVGIALGYNFPSTVSDAILQALPGAPYSLSTASRGTVFVIADTHVRDVALPVDSLTGSLLITKKASKSTAAVGDYLQYVVTAEEQGAFIAPNVEIIDTLPRGFVYKTGSAMINGVTTADPTISADHRTLTFAVGSMAALSTTEVKYVVEVASGAQPGDAVNTAYANINSITASNTASVTVRVYEDLFRAKATVMGRVIADDCGNAETDSELSGGVYGVRIYMEDGSYVVTDDKGMFHFKGVKPGGHVLQLDYDSLPPQYKPVLCDDSTETAGSDFSRFVDVSGGALWRSDFHLALKPHSIGELTVTFDSKAMEGGELEYAVKLSVGNVGIDNARATVMLPDGVSYKSGTSRLSDAAIAEPSDMAGSLTFRLGAMQKDSTGELTFRALAPVEGERGEFDVKALITFDTVNGKNMRTPLMDNILIRDYEEDIKTSSFVIDTRFDPSSDILSEADKKELDELISGISVQNIDHIFTFGHTDSMPLSARAKQKFRNNYHLSRQRAKTIAEYVGNALGLDAKSISYVGHGPDKPIADNATKHGRKRNRRVEIKAFYKKVERNYLLKAEQGQGAQAEMETLGARGGASYLYTEEIDYTLDTDSKIPLFDEIWMRGIEPGLGWVWPEDGVHPASPSLTMAIKHKPGSSLNLVLNGESVNMIYTEGTKFDESRTRAVTVFKGIPLKDGDNDLVVTQIFEGAETHSFTRIVHYSTAPVKAELLPLKSSLRVDGMVSPVVAVRLTDMDGYPVRKGTMGEFTVNPPYKALEDEIGTDDSLMEGRSRYTVRNDGIAYIMLAPTALAGEASINIHMTEGDAEIKPWLKAEPRDWILVGFAEGTLAHSTLSGNAQSLDEMGYEPDLYNEGRLAFFAKGRVKGKWLLTAAYDSAKQSFDERNLFSEIDPDEYYVLYGDSTQQGNEAMSSRKLYLKIENDKFYALFGDYETGLSVTKLSRYSRRLNGLKSEYMGERFRYRAFVSDTSQAFVKDELPADGTTGLYKLTRNNIVMNSEVVTITVRDRFSPDIIVSEHIMRRHLDYNIDYRDGSLFFHHPVNSTDGGFNPVTIVVDYESFDGSDSSMNYGARAAVVIPGGKGQVGASVIHEASVGREGDLAGMDATINVTENAQVKAEYAATTNDDGITKVDGSAYLLEVSAKGKRLSATAYTLEQEAGFGLGQQGSADSGVKRTGIEAKYKAGRRFDIGSQFYTQSNSVTGIDRDFTELNGKYSMGNIVYMGGIRSTVDTLSDGSEAESQQLVAGIKYRTLGGKLLLSAAREQSLSSGEESVDFPTNTKLGAEYMLANDSSVFIEQEFSESDVYERSMTRGGIKLSPWKDSRVDTSLERQSNENGTRVFSNFGLVQDWRINKNWAMSASFDSRNTIVNDPSSMSLVNSPVAATEDFTAVSMGATFEREGFAWRGLIEHRKAATSDKVGLSTSVFGEPKEGLGLSAGLRVFKTDSDVGTSTRDMDIRLGLVSRPAESRWIILDRLDYIAEKENGGLFEFDTWRLVNNLNANFRPSAKIQTSLQYGLKYVKDSIDGLDYKGYTDLMGAEVRYNITSRWDVGGVISLLHSYEPDISDQQIGVSVGWVAAKNMWLSMGYNYDGYRDRDFSRANYTAKGMYLKLRFKFDQLSLKDAIKYFNGTGGI